MLTLAKSSLSGHVMGKPIEGFVLDKGADAAPAPGEYDLLPPLDDPIFGSYIIAMRRDAGYKPARIWTKLSAETGVAVSHEGIKLPAARMDRFDKRTVAEGDASFVLSKQPIPGRNCVVLAAGFSDLLDALRDVREAVLTVI